MALKKVRILVDCHFGRCNEVAELNAAQIKEAKPAGLIDDHPDAVKHAENLNAGTPGAVLDPVDPTLAATDTTEPGLADNQPGLDLDAPAAPVSPETADPAEDHGRKAGRKA